MFDAEAGRAFAAFVLALLPRLLLYPGGLFALLVAGLLSRLIRVSPRLVAESPSPAPSEAGAILALALGWAGLALLPLPGLAPLPGGPDALVPLGLLPAASWLLLPAPVAADRRALGGYLLLLLAPLLALAQSSAGSLLRLLPPTTAVEAGIRWLILLAFCAGFAVISTQPVSRDFISHFRLHIPRIGFIGVGMLISPLILPVELFWINPLVLTALACLTTWLGALPQAQRWVGRAVAVGWAALGLALVGVLVQGL